MTLRTGEVLVLWSARSSEVAKAAEALPLVPSFSAFAAICELIKGGGGSVHTSQFTTLGDGDSVLLACST